MARKRMVSPDFFSSGPVNDLPIPAMVTFAGLWVYFDDHGRGEDDVSLIKSAVWPRRRSQTEAKVRGDLLDIARKGLICRYEVGGYRLMHSPSWTEHQKISHPTESKLPPCPWHDDLLYREFVKDRGGPLEKFRNESRDDPERFHDSVVKSSSDLDKGSSGGLSEVAKKSREHISLVLGSGGAA